MKSLKIRCIAIRFTEHYGASHAAMPFMPSRRTSPTTPLQRPILLRHPFDLHVVAPACHRQLPHVLITLHSRHLPDYSLLTSLASSSYVIDHGFAFVERVQGQGPRRLQCRTLSRCPGRVSVGLGFLRNSRRRASGRPLQRGRVPVEDRRAGNGLGRRGGGQAVRRPQRSVGQGTDRKSVV